MEKNGRERGRFYGVTKGMGEEGVGKRMVREREGNALWEKEREKR